jgi:photosystem I subunit 10
MLFFAAVPSTPSWSPTIGIVMVLCNLGAIVLWKSMVALINAWLGGIGYEARATSVSAGGDGMTFNLGFATLTLPELIAGACFGHVIGAGVILGLSYLGAL